jgi:hypothetical protein
MLGSALRVGDRRERRARRRPKIGRWEHRQRWPSGCRPTRLILDEGSDAARMIAMRMREHDELGPRAVVCESALRVPRVALLPAPVDDHPVVSGRADEHEFAGAWSEHDQQQTIVTSAREAHLA